MTLDEISFDQIKIGTKVLSAIKTPGEVVDVSKNPRYQDSDQDGWTVTITWASGRTTDYVWWWMLGNVEVVSIP